MSVGVVIFGLLNADATTTGLVGGRIYPDVSPQRDPRPSIVYQLISQIPNNTLGPDGASTLDICRVQIAMSATTRAMADQIGDAVRNVLKNVFHTTVSGVYVDWCRYDSSNSYFDNNSDQDGLYVLSQDYKISIRI
jgi:hypothetical protein